MGFFNCINHMFCSTVEKFKTNKANKTNKNNMANTKEKKIHLRS